MRKRNLIMLAAVVTSSVLPLAGQANAADAPKKLKIQTSFASGYRAFAELNHQLVPQLEKATDGHLTLDLLPNGSVVPHRDTPDAVAHGVLDGDFTSVAYFSGRDPAFALLGNLTAGYDTPAQARGFCQNGPGEKLLQKLWNKYVPGKIHVVGCAPYTNESLVSTVPIRNVSDLKGLKIRTPEGLEAAVFRQAGATPVNIPVTDVFTALQQGTVEAADDSAYDNNQGQGMNKIAHYPTFPGWNSMPVLQLTVSESDWKAMTPAEQKALHTWFYKAMTQLAKASHQRDLKDVKADKSANNGVHVIDWSQAQRNKFRSIAQHAWKTFSKKSPLAKEVYDAQVAYLKKIGLLK